jgi:hypothetical protein
MQWSDQVQIDEEYKKRSPYLSKTYYEEVHMTNLDDSWNEVFKDNLRVAKSNIGGISKKVHLWC